MTDSDAVRAGIKTRNWLRALWITGLWSGLLVFLFLWAGEWPGADAWRPLLSAETGRAAVLFGIVFMLSLVVRALRWHLLLSVRMSVPFSHVLAVYGWTFLLKSLTPYRAGDALRALWVRRAGGELSFGLSNLLFERVLDILFLALLGSVILILIVLHQGRHWSLLIGMLLVVAAAVLILSGLSFFQRGLERFRAGLKPVSGSLFSRLLHKAFDIAELILRGLLSVSERRTKGISVGLTVSTWLLLSCGYWVFIDAVFPQLGWSSAALLIVMVNLIGVLGGTPGNIGSYEFAGVAALGAFGVDAPSALPVVAALHILVLGSTLIFGFFGRLLLQKHVSRAWDLF